MDFVVTTPVDTPFLPHDFAGCLVNNFNSSKNGRPVVAQYDNRVHELHALWPIACMEKLKSLILNDDIYKVKKLHKKLESHVCDFEIGAIDPFININTAVDLVNARKALSFIKLARALGRPHRPEIRSRRRLEEVVIPLPFRPLPFLHSDFAAL